LNTTFIIAV